MSESDRGRASAFDPHLLEVGAYVEPDVRATVIAELKRLIRNLDNASKPVEKLGRARTSDLTRTPPVPFTDEQNRACISEWIDWKMRELAGFEFEPCETCERIKVAGQQPWPDGEDWECSHGEFWRPCASCAQKGTPYAYLGRFDRAWLVELFMTRTDGIRSVPTLDELKGML